MYLLKTASLLVFFFIVTTSDAQEISQTRSRLKIYLDCQNVRCDFNFIRSEINIVDFLLDRLAADVHILITEQRNGSGGKQFQMIFFGQHLFGNSKDTIKFNTGPNATEFEIRDVFIKNMKLGLVPYLTKTGYISDIDIKMKNNSAVSDSEKENGIEKDPWNYWVFRSGAYGNIFGESIYKSTNLNGQISANRTTEELKVNFKAWAGKNKAQYQFFNDNGNSENLIIKNSNYGIQHSLVKSISEKWSTGYEMELKNSTFSNNKLLTSIRAGFEYNIYPYTMVNSKFFTISYGLLAQNNSYYDSTIYNKLNETLTGHFANSNISIKHKWGSMYGGIEYRNFFKDFSLNNLEVSLGLDVRITGGLSFNIDGRYNLVHDQVYLQKGGATEQEILTRRRQLQTNFNYWLFFGLNYRFGSKLNNFINPRFEDGR